MGFEPTTFWLATRSSTPELRSHYLGAYEGNRTLVTWLEARSSTIELHTHLSSKLVPGERIELPTPAV